MAPLVASVGFDGGRMGDWKSPLLLPPLLSASRCGAGGRGAPSPSSCVLRSSCRRCPSVCAAMAPPAPTYAHSSDPWMKLLTVFPGKLAFII